MDITQLLLAGDVSSDDDGLAVTRWLRRVRPETTRLAVSGGLLFDGESWLQLFEGTANAVGALRNILVDEAALGAAVLLFDRADAGLRVCRHWSCGYVEPGAIESLRQVAADADQTALALFAATLNSVDAS